MRHQLWFANKTRQCPFFFFSALSRWHNGKAAHENVVIKEGYEGAVSSVLGVCLSTNVNKWRFFVQFL